MSLSATPGLCGACTHARVIQSGKRSTFWMCALWKSDSRFRKYPPLPVIRCPGFEPEPQAEASDRAT